MSRWFLRFSGLLTCLCVLGLVLHPAAGFGQQSKVNGLPNSTRFGYGARFYAQGPQAGWALNAAAAIELDWIAIDLSWQDAQPSPGQALLVEHLDHFIQSSLSQPTSILISITAAPAWAMLPNGPNPELVGALVREIILRYPGRAFAFELFPGANTLRGWGAPPDPAAYAALLHSVRASLSDLNSDLTLVAAGLAANASPTPAGDMNDLEYLQRLYAAGAADTMPIISIRLPAVQSDLLAIPAPGQPVVLRHYELVRQVMLNAGHASGLVWITGFSWPAGDASSHEQRLQQALWLEQAYALLQAQLYIGTAFYSCLNSPSETGQSGFVDAGSGCLIDTQQVDPVIHPAVSLLASSIYTARTGQAPQVQALLEKQAANTKIKYGKLR